MIYTKKIVHISSALIITGFSMTSFVSANGSDKEVSYTVTSSGVSTEGTTDFNTT